MPKVMNPGAPGPGHRSRAAFIHKSSETRLPEGTVIPDIFGGKLSSWEGNYALVFASNKHYPGIFDPRGIARRFQVLPILDQMTSRPVPAELEFLNQEPLIDDPRVPYSNATGNIGGRLIRFGERHTYWVSVPLNELSPREMGELDSYWLSGSQIDASEGVCEADDAPPTCVGDRYGLNFWSRLVSDDILTKR